jgi:hypothetical protein
VNAGVYGISIDTPFTLEVFAQQNNLNFPLLSDANREAIRAFEVVWPDLAGVRDVGSRAVIVLNGAGDVVYRWVGENPCLRPPLAGGGTGSTTCTACCGSERRTAYHNRAAGAVTYARNSCRYLPNRPIPVILCAMMDRETDVQSCRVCAVAGSGPRRVHRAAVRLWVTMVVVVVAPFLSSHANPRPGIAAAAAAGCGILGPAVTGAVRLGRPYVHLAFEALAADRATLAGLGPQVPSAVLSTIAEQHSAYMAAIGTWSDGDPAGTILDRVHAAGLNAVYAGQNVVTELASDVPSAVATGEAFFAQEAVSGGPHWDNIVNPHHRFVGIGIAVTGAPGAYTIYLTQVFSDAGGCAAAGTPLQGLSTAAAQSIPLHAGQLVHPTVDVLELRTEPGGRVIEQLSTTSQLKVLGTLEGWVHVKALATDLFGWVFGGMVSA